MMWAVNDKDKQQIRVKVEVRSSEKGDDTVSTKRFEADMKKVWNWGKIFLSIV